MRISARRRVFSISALLAAGMSLLLVVPAESFVPRAERVVAAVAKSNKKARRTSALRVEITLRIEDGDVVARGELISHPTGLARLELKTPGGLIERHLMLTTEHRAARNGELLATPRAFLPPIFFMQANTATVLDLALTTFGVRADLVGLAPCGQRDCYVVGNPERATLRERIEIESVVEYTRIATSEGSESPLDPSHDPTLDSAEGASPESDPALQVEQAEQAETEPPPPSDAANDSADDLQVAEMEEESSSDVELDGKSENVFASVWIDADGYDLVKVRSSEGVEIAFGPMVAFGKRLRFPEWWTIEEPGKPIVRFDVIEVGSVTAPTSVFSEEWMLGPTAPGELDPEDPVTP